MLGFLLGGALGALVDNATGDDSLLDGAIIGAVAGALLDSDTNTCYYGNKHDWRPFLGKYKCLGCDAIGYKK